MLRQEIEFKEIAKLVNNKTFTFLRKVKKMVNYLVRLIQKKYQILLKKKLVQM